MKLISRLLLLGVAWLSLCPPAAVSAQRDRIAVVGVLVGAAAPSDRAVAAFRAGLRDLGYEEGRNLRIEFRTAQGHLDRLPRLVNELLQLKPDVIVVGNEHGAQVLKRATSTIPIVLVNITDPVGARLVPNLSRPGGNITGLSSMAAELIPKRLELLKEAIPQLAKVTVLHGPTGTPSSGYNQRLTEELRLAAPSMSVTLRFVEARTANELPAAFKKTNQLHKEAVYVAECALCYSERKKLTQLAAATRIPAIYVTRGFAEEGGLMSYGVDYAAQSRHAAIYVDKILQGASPGDLPIEQPTKLELVVNLKTAKTLGIDIPESILARADEVIR